MKQIVWSRRAKHELAALLAYYAQFSPALPARLIDDVDRATAMLLDHPRLGPELSDSSVRKWLATNTPFLLFYRPTGACIRILKVRDARSDWKDR